MQVLLRLAETPLEVVRKDELIRSVWSDTFVTDDVLTHSISELRKAFDDDARHPALIETIPKNGYRLLVPATDPGNKPSAKPLSTLGMRHAVPKGTRSTASPSQALRLGGLIGTVREHPYSMALFGVVSVGMLMVFLLFLTNLDRPRFLTNRVTIVVLPFVNLGGDPAEEYLSDGMTEEVITALGRVNPDRLGVIARTSAMHYKRTDRNVRQIGDELGAEYVLEGSVRHTGDHIRVTAQLIKVRDQTDLWAQAYEALDFNEIRGVQTEIRNAVAKVLLLKTNETAGNLAHVNPEAYQLYLKGRYFLDRRDRASLAKALGYFHQSVTRDGSFARAWAGVALSYELLEYVRAISPRESYSNALSAATHAVQADSESAEAHTALAYVHEHYEWNWAEADRELGRALTLDPSYELARQWFSYGLLRRGDVQRAAEEMRRALELDPVSFRVNLTMAERLERAGRHEDAIQQYVNALELNPNDADAHSRLGELYGSKGALTLAAAEYRHGLQLSGNRELEKRFNDLNARLGFTAAFSAIEAEQLRASLQDLDLRAGRGEYVSPADYALTYALLGDRKQALEWLQRAYQEHASIMLELGSPMFDKIRDAPQFQHLVRQVGLQGTSPLAG